MWPPRYPRPQPLPRILQTTKAVTDRRSGHPPKQMPSMSARRHVHLKMNSATTPPGLEGVGG
eukprot:5805762-Alexandrium_andersonii.AAC.1